MVHARYVLGDQMKIKLFLGPVLAVFVLAVPIIISKHPSLAEQALMAQNGNIQAGAQYVPHTPTGCPYGDSIPLDSPKCAPPPVYAAPVEPGEFQGK